MYNQNNTEPRGPHNTKPMRPNKSGEHPSIHAQPQKKPKVTPKRPRIYNDFLTDATGEGGDLVIDDGSYALKRKGHAN